MNTPRKRSRPRRPPASLSLSEALLKVTILLSLLVGSLLRRRLSWVSPRTLFLCTITVILQVEEEVLHRQWISVDFANNALDLTLHSPHIRSPYFNGASSPSLSLSWPSYSPFLSRRPCDGRLQCEPKAESLGIVAAAETPPTLSLASDRSGDSELARRDQIVTQTDIFGLVFNSPWVTNNTHGRG